MKWLCLHCDAISQRWKMLTEWLRGESWLDWRPVLLDIGSRDGTMKERIRFGISLRDAGHCHYSKCAYFSKYYVHPSGYVVMLLVYKLPSDVIVDLITGASSNYICLDNDESSLNSDYLERSSERMRTQYRQILDWVMVLLLCVLFLHFTFCVWCCNFLY